MGKPYDTVTGLYNYGYRDYSPQTAHEFLRSKNLGKQTDRFATFTTTDPIRDGNNWFSYVMNDPVNYVDAWGLSASDGGKEDKITNAINTLSDTKWGKTKEGKVIIEELNKLNADGKITTDNLSDGTRAIVAKNNKTGEIVFIKINNNIPDKALPGRLTHEGTHINNYKNDMPPSLDDEKLAFTNAFSVDKELNSPIQDMPSDNELEKRYPNLNWL